MGRLVTVRSFRDPVDAGIARARLELAGIPSLLLDENLIAVQWLYSRALGGVKLAVDEADLEAARGVLAQDESGDVALAALPDASDASPDADEGCPACGSTRIRSSKLQRRAAALSLLTSLPLIAWRHRWICDACGHSWRDSGGGSGELPPETLAAERLVHRHRPYPMLRGLVATLLGLTVLWYVQYRLRNP
jgi:hypothetical protein